MAKKINPDFHLICGKCGCATMFEFEFSPGGSDDGCKIYPAIFITCGNCGTLTGLNEYVEDKTDWDKLNMTTKY